MKVPYIIGPNGKRYITHEGIATLLKQVGGSVKPKVKAKKSAKPVKAGLRNNRGILFCIGDVVALREGTFKSKDPSPETFAGQPIKMARITALLSGRDKSVQLNKKLGGYWTWSVEDLRKVPVGQVKHAA